RPPPPVREVGRHYALHRPTERATTEDDAFREQDLDAFASGTSISSLEAVRTSMCECTRAFTPERFSRPRRNDGDAGVFVRRTARCPSRFSRHRVYLWLPRSAQRVPIF